MNISARILGVGIAAMALSACTATVPPVEVTRFHNAQSEPIARGSIAVTSILEPGAGLLEERTFEAAVMQELLRAGFTEGGAEDSEYAARLSVDRSRIDAVTGRSPVSVGVGGNTGSYGSGVGLGIGINLSGKPKDRIATQLSVRIARASNDDVIWEGRAFVEAKDGSPAAQPGLVASKLAQALFTNFPGESGQTVSVK